MYPRFLVTLLICFTLVGCASVKQNPDPLEGFNRKVHIFNEGLDNFALKPLAKGYMFVTPDIIEASLHNFVLNLFYPTVFINQFLQGKAKLGVQDTGRFLINTTFGIGGLFDVAEKFGLKYHQEDFGQTLAVWGVKDSPYLVLPLFGPSTVRDGAGRIADIFTNPMYYINDNETRYSLFALSVIDTRAELLKTEGIITGDKYLFMRDAYLQRREFLISDKKAPESDPFLEE